MATATEASSAEFEAALRRDVESQTFGSTTVRQVRTVPGEDADGNDALFVTLVLSDPSDATWPMEDVLEIRRRVRALAEMSTPGVRYYVAIKEEHEGPQVDEDDAPDSIG